MQPCVGIRNLGNNKYSSSILEFSNNLTRVRRVYPNWIKDFPGVIKGNEQDRENLSKFLKEQYDNQSKIDHPNIVRFHSFEEDSEKISFVRSYVKGKSLNDLICEQGPQDPQFCIKILHIMSQALDYLHSIGLMAMNLKPQNVIITDDGCKLVDLCVYAIFLEEISSPCSISSCVASVDRKPDSKFDIFQLGIIFYVMLTGNLPWDKKRNMARIMQQIVTDSIMIPNFIDPNFKLIILDMFKSNPGERPSAAEVSDRLHGIRFTENRIRMHGQPIAVSHSLRNVVVPCPQLSIKHLVNSRARKTVSHIVHKEALPPIRTA